MTYLSYLRRRAMSDVEGPITSPSQVDDTIIVGTVPPRRVECSALPADSPWKRPGQVCAPTPVDAAVDFLRDLFSAATTPTISASSPQPPAAALPKATPHRSILLLVAAGGLGYYLLSRKRRS